MEALRRAACSPAFNVFIRRSPRVHPKDARGNSQAALEFASI